jgi:Na+-transporting methylmalonyl-CoA/oxaloacetate decarboxylase gamma subunit
MFDFHTTFGLVCSAIIVVYFLCRGNLQSRFSWGVVIIGVALIMASTTHWNETIRLYRVITATASAVQTTSAPPTSVPVAHATPMHAVPTVVLPPTKRHVPVAALHANASAAVSGPRTTLLTWVENVIGGIFFLIILVVVILLMSIVRRKSKAVSSPIMAYVHAQEQETRSQDTQPKTLPRPTRNKKKLAHARHHTS